MLNNSKSFTMVYLNGKCTKDLKILLTRIPFNDSTNKSTMSHRNNNAQKQDIAVGYSEKTGRKLVNRNNKTKISKSSNHSDNNEQVKTRDKQIKSLAAITINMPNILLTNIDPEDKSEGTITSNQAIDLEEKKGTLVPKNTPFKKRLRKCQRTNYHESTLEHSTVIEDVPSIVLMKTRVPIYKQNVSTRNKPLDKKLSKDPYDLDISDSENGKPKNKKLNTSRKFDKTMYDVLERLEKDNKKSRKKIPVTKTLKPPGEYQKSINNAIKKVMKKISKKNIASTSQEKNEKISSQRVPEEPKTINTNSESEKHNSICNEAVHNIENPSSDLGIRYIETIHGYENDNGLLGFDISRKTFKDGDIIQVPSVSKVKILGDVILTSAHSTIGHNDDVESDIDCSHSDKNYFGFGEEENDDMGSHAFFVQRRPNANSTMIENRSKSPWRVTTFLKRKPYLLSVKTSALPNLQQEMVLDHTIVEDIEKHFTKSISEASNPKKSVQTSILDYVESSIDHTLEDNQEDHVNSSLFNYEEFNVTTPKRRVLGILQECSLSDRQVIYSPTLRNPSNQSLNMSVLDQVGGQSNIGFDTADNVVEKENRPDTGKPFRLNLAGIHRNVTMSNDNFEYNSQHASIDEDIQTALETDGTDVQLFDDVDKEFEGEMSIHLPKIKYQRNTRRRRLHSDASDNEEDDRPKKKKKDMMTKAEEAAFDEWAAKFNSMCEEVDQHDLEIE